MGWLLALGGQPKAPAGSRLIGRVSSANSVSQCVIVGLVPGAEQPNAPPAGQVVCRMSGSEPQFRQPSFGCPPAFAA
jgi:hypothetical protein